MMDMHDDYQRQGKGIKGMHDDYGGGQEKYNSGW